MTGGNRLDSKDGGMRTGRRERIRRWVVWARAGIGAFGSFPKARASSMAFNMARISEFCSPSGDAPSSSIDDDDDEGF